MSRKFHLANDAMYSFAQEVICPTGAYNNARHPRLHCYMPYLDGCVGALDGVHVLVVVAREVHDEWINRKGFTSQNVLAICDHDGRFIYVGARMKGACHDMAVLRECE
jgi:NAD(P)H-flavin reductase